MSAPLRLTASQLKDISYALSDLTKIRNAHGVLLGSHGIAEITHAAADVALAISWSDDDGYYIDDRSGS